MASLGNWYSAAFLRRRAAKRRDAASTLLARLGVDDEVWGGKGVLDCLYPIPAAEAWGIRVVAEVGARQDAASTLLARLGVDDRGVREAKAGSPAGFQS